MNDWGRLEGLIPMCGGIYGLLMAYKVLPKKPYKDPVKMEEWQKKYGSLLKKISPFLILFGLSRLVGLW